MSHIFVKTTKMEINSKFDSSSIEKNGTKSGLIKIVFLQNQQKKTLYNCYTTTKCNWGSTYGTYAE